MNKTVRNEHKKLLATWYNNFSIAILVVGFLTPLWTIISEPPKRSRTIVEDLASLFALSSGYSYLAWRALGNLEE